jgi:E3 ubiquitin-protein ligase HERC2
MRRVCAGIHVAFAIGEDGELFSWGNGDNNRLGHGDGQDHPSPELVEALRSVRVSRVAAGSRHVLALAEDGQVFAWGENWKRAVFGSPHVEEELRPYPVPVGALRGVRVSSIAVAWWRNYAVTDTGELWAWGCDGHLTCPLGHGEQVSCPLPKPIESLRGVKVDAVTADIDHTLALADDGSVYAWGRWDAARSGALGLGPAVSDAHAEADVPTPRRAAALRVTRDL